MAQGKIEKPIRLTLSLAELQQIYSWAGAEIGRLRDGGTIRDERPSTFAKQITDLEYLQDRINKAVSSAAEKEPAEPAKS